MLNALISGGLALAGNILQGRSEKKATEAAQSAYPIQLEADFNQARRLAQMQHYMTRRANRKSNRNQWGSLVKGAQKAGFNPLTLVGQQARGGLAQTSGTAGPIPTSSPLSIGQSIANAAQVGFDQYLAEQEDPIEKEGRRLANENLRLRNEQIKNETLRVQGVRTTPGPDETRGEDAEEQGPPPSPDHMDRSRVFLPFKINDKGTVRHMTADIPNEVLERNNLSPNTLLTAGDLAEIFGESSEVFTALKIDQVLDILGNSGLLTDSQMKQLEKDSEKLTSSRTRKDKRGTKAPAPTPNQPHKKRTRNSGN